MFSQGANESFGEQKMDAYGYHINALQSAAISIRTAVHFEIHKTKSAFIVCPSKKFMSMPSSKKIMTTMLGTMDLLLVDILPRVAIVISKCYCETLDCDAPSVKKTWSTQ